MIVFFRNLLLNMFLKILGFMLDVVVKFKWFFYLFRDVGPKRRVDTTLP